MSREPLQHALDMLMHIAAGEPYVMPDTSGEDETFDALLVGLDMLAEDLTAERAGRKRALALLQDERDAYDRSPALLCSVDSDSMAVVKCNGTLARSLGVTLEKIVGLPLASLFVDKDQPAADIAFRAVARGEERDVPDLALAREGAPLWVSTSVSRSEDPTPRLRIVWRDVTLERKLEQQLIQAQKMQAVGRLSGGVAHDFNNILAVIMTSTSLVRSGLPADSSAEEDLLLIDDAARRGADLTSQLLSFSRQLVVRPQRVDVGALVRDVDRMLQRLIREDITLSIVVVHDLVAHVDPAQLSQVLINLVVNARDALPHGGRITVEASDLRLDNTFAHGHLDVTPGDYVLISVTDDGVGMPPDVLAQVFEPFYTTKNVGEGSGLGLSVCYGIVRQAGGHIYVYSEVDGGTVVRVYLPRSDGRADTASPVRTVPPATGTETLLLVEDDETLRTLTQRVLAQAGYRVLVAVNGEDALAVAAAHEGAIELVITDVVMPRMGGRALVEQLTSEGRVARALYVSGYTANAIVHHGVLEDGVAFVAKPFTATQLLQAVRDTLQGKPHQH